MARKESDTPPRTQKNPPKAKEERQSNSTTKPNSTGRLDGKQNSTTAVDLDEANNQTMKNEDDFTAEKHNPDDEVRPRMDPI